MNDNKIKFSPTKAHQRYKMADGVQVPGVTTVLNVIAKPALLNWAWECGCKGEDYRKVRDHAADAGTLGHWLVECHLKRQEPDLSDFAPAVISLAESAYIKWLTWWDKSGFELVSSEAQLVSDTHAYGGTLDILARDRDGNMTLVDLKTSKAIYEEYWHQVAAYGQLYDEKAEKKITRYIICRIGKETDDADFEVQERTSVAKNLAVFNAALVLYRAMKAK